MLGVITIVFLLFNVLPGDPARMMLGQRADVSSVEAINKELGLDKPLMVQYLLYLNDLSPISWHNNDPEQKAWNADPEKFGSIHKLIGSAEGKGIYIKQPYLRRSYQTGRTVSSMLADALPGTAILAVSSLVFASIFGILLGIIAALYRNKPADHFSMLFAILGMSVPSFFAGILIAWIFGYVLSEYTGLNMTGSLYYLSPFEGEVLQLKNLILPTLTLGLRPLSVIVQLTRNSMIDVVSRDYIRTARAKGLSKKAILVKHALRNALNPVLTAISGWLGSLLAGAVFVEFIFGWKGVGKTLVDALEKYDFPVVMGSVLFIAGVFVLINIFVDILYGYLDPRVRVES